MLKDTSISKKAVNTKYVYFAQANVSLDIDYDASSFR